MAWPDPFTRKHTVQVGAVEMFVAELGEGVPIVMLHGNPDTHSVWATVASQLTGLRVIAPDLPGFGQSRAPDDMDLSVEAQGELVRGFVSALELDRFHLVVHDIGGPYGLAFATLHPQRLLSLTVLNTLFFPDYKWHFWARMWRRRGIGEAAMAIANRPLFVRELKRGSPGMPREYAELAYHEFTSDAKRMVLRWYRAMDPSVFTGWDTRLVAAVSTLPTQVLWGDADPFIPSRFAERLGGTVTHTKDGHWLMVENPDFVAAKINALTSPA
jgi:pimeloyl-ACP methyl ester carboxylesterase